MWQQGYALLALLFSPLVGLAPVSMGLSYSSVGVFFYPEADRQEESIVLTVEAQQIDLPIRPRPANPVAEVPLEVILRQPSRLAVIQLQIHAAGLTDDQVAAELNIDAAQWSRIMSGKNHFPTEKYHRLNQITGSHCVLLWDMAQEGLDPASVRPLRSALERQLEEERARNADLQREMSIMQRYIRMAAGRD